MNFQKVGIHFNFFEVEIKLVNIYTKEEQFDGIESVA